MLYLSAKTQIRRIIDKYFPPEMSIRFTIRSDSQIWIPKEDEGVWNRWKSGNENFHILFDGLLLIEIPSTIKPELAEVWFLKAFRKAISDGKISFKKKLEWTDNETAKRNKKEKEVKKKKKVKDAIDYALQNPFDHEEIERQIEHIGKRKVYRKGGD